MSNPLPVDLYRCNEILMDNVLTHINIINRKRHLFPRVRMSVGWRAAAPCISGTSITCHNLYRRLLAAHVILVRIDVWISLNLARWSTLGLFVFKIKLYNIVKTFVKKFMFELWSIQLLTIVLIKEIIKKKKTKPFTRTFQTYCVNIKNTLVYYKT